jgi:hypothetical protein
MNTTTTESDAILHYSKGIETLNRRLNGEQVSDLDKAHALAVLTTLIKELDREAPEAADRLRVAVIYGLVDGGREQVADQCFGYLVDRA